MGFPNSLEKYRTDLYRSDLPIPVEIVETDIDLYYRMAFTLYRLIEENNQAGRPTTVILPVGPVYQYRRFVWLQKERPLDLRKLVCFFMDEYLTEEGNWIDETSPLSFRGFIRQELLQPLQDPSLPSEARLFPNQILFPDPHNLAWFDQLYEERGGADICFAGIGITGHLAFNEPPDLEKLQDTQTHTILHRPQDTDPYPAENLKDKAPLGVKEFCDLPSRVVKLARETIAINSNTALRGAMDLIPSRAVTIGFRQILQARKIRLYCNRPWQSAVVRRALFDPESPAFPVTLVRRHPDVRMVVTSEVAAPPSFGLR